MLSRRPTTFDEQRRKAYLKFYFGSNASNGRTLTDEQIDRVLSMIDSVAPQLATFHQQLAIRTAAQRAADLPELKKQVDQAIAEALISLAASDPDAAAKINAHVVEHVKNNVRVHLKANTPSN